MKTTWWWERLSDEDGLMMRTTWWWERLDDEDGLMMRTTWWWERLDDENDLMMRTIYLSTLNWADKEFFLTFLYIARLGQAWQNPSDINPKVGLRALISPTRSDINPRVGFELLSEIQPYGQASLMSRFRQTPLDRSRTGIRHLIIEDGYAPSAKSGARRSEKLTMRWSSMITRMNHSDNLCKKQIWIAFLRSHLTFRGKTQNTLLAYSRSKHSQHSLQQVNPHQRKLTSSNSSQQCIVYRISSRAKEEDCCERKSL
jgi:hypothetical protein